MQLKQLIILISSFSIACYLLLATQPSLAESKNLAILIDANKTLDLTANIEKFADPGIEGVYELAFENVYQQFEQQIQAENSQTDSADQRDEDAIQIPTTIAPTTWLAPQKNWFRLSISNPHPQASLHTLSAGEARVGYLYQMLENGEIKTISKMQALGLHEVFIIKLPKESTTTFYFKYKYNNPNRIILEPFDAIFLSKNHPLFFLGSFYCGVMLATFALNVYLVYTTKYRRYKYYCLYVFAIIVIFAIDYIQPYTQLDLSLLATIALQSPNVFALLFMMEVLETKTRAYKVHIYTKFVLFFYFILFILTITTDGNLGSLPHLVALLSYTCMLGAGITTMIGGLQIAKWYCLAWGSFVAFSATAVISGNYTYFIPGVILECTLISLIFATLIKNLSNTYLAEREIHRRVAKDLHALRRSLEKRVAQRTEEIRVTNEKLEATIDKLKSTQQELVEMKKMSELGKLLQKVSSLTEKPILKSLNIAQSMFHQLNSILDKQQKKQTTIDDLNALVENMKVHAFSVGKLLKESSEIIKTFKKISVENTVEKISHFSLRDHLASIINSFHNNNQKIKVHLEADDACMLKSYQGVIYQITNQLIENAILHAFDDTIASPQITITTRTVDQRIDFIISDNGIGVARSDLDSLFEAFYTVDKSQVTNGLGLHIVKNLVIHRLQGEINCQSNAGNGFMICIRLPLAIDEEMHAVVEPTAMPL